MQAKAITPTNFKRMPDCQKLTLEHDNIDKLVQERHNSSALAMELRLSCINPWIYVQKKG